MSAPGPVVILGGSGLLGAALVRELRRRGAPHAAPSRGDLDLGEIARIEGRLRAMSPSALVNASAFTDVAAAERPENRAETFLLNRDVPAELARVASVLAVPFVHVSTDYVFDGEKGGPYDEADAPSPVQVYGESKLEGERSVLGIHPRALVARTSTLYGPTERARATYVDAILALAEREPALSVVELPVATPTYAPDLAALLLDLLDAGATGVVHAANEGACSRLELARAIVAEAGRDVEVHVKPAPRDGLRRPRNSALAIARLASILGRRPRPWREALREYVRGRTGGPRP